MTKAREKRKVPSGEDWEKFKKDLERVNVELTLELGKKGLPDWRLWFDTGKKPICGVQLFRYLKLYPEEKEKYIRNYAKSLRDLIKGRNLEDVESGVKKVFNKLINDHEAIGGSLDLGAAYFWGGLSALTTKELLSSIDELTVPIEEIEKILIKSNAEDEINETIDRKKELNEWLHSLKEPDFSIVSLIIEEGYTSEEDLAEKYTTRTGKKISQPTVHRIIERHFKDKSFLKSQQ